MSWIRTRDLKAASVEPELVDLFAARTGGRWEIKPREKPVLDEPVETLAEYARLTKESANKRVQITNAANEHIALLKHVIQKINRQREKKVNAETSKYLALVKALFESDNGKRTVHEINAEYGKNISEHADLLTVRRKLKTRAEFLEFAVPATDCHKISRGRL